MLNYDALMFAHLVTIVPCVFLGGLLLVKSKGGKIHRNLGKVYMTLMMITSLITLFMPAHVGPRFLNHFGWIHLFSFLTLYSIPTALIAIRKGQVKRHKFKMILLYFGAIIIAGGFTFAPGRYLNELFFN